jgi:hypothetical protein
VLVCNPSRVPKLANADLSLGATRVARNQPLRWVWWRLSIQSSEISFEIKLMLLGRRPEFRGTWISI